MAKNSEINVIYTLDSDSRKDLKEKDGSLQPERSIFINANKYSKSVVFVTYEFAHILAPKKKKLTEADDIIKPAFNIVAIMHVSMLLSIEISLLYYPRTSVANN
ncbi:hypothetical protein RF11_13456 [Thelohanellus kitauei]|uniref:Uncharacterized protein n=1 Tax=Thelohanellus kitauei TaxID=669202 RepID=A0A0C2MZB1_THEKT|nr:hypothetical protein RF11_13456 [Thelohanellus kitauei]